MCLRTLERLGERLVCNITNSSLVRLGLSWDAMLKMTDIKLELMVDVDQYLFIEHALRGGVSYTAHRYAKANNKYMKNYDEKKHITYLDCNNLYGAAMSQFLPTGNSNGYRKKKSVK